MSEDLKQSVVQENVDSVKEPTPEEIRKAKDVRKGFYLSETNYLKAERDFLKVKAEIEGLRAEIMTSQLKQAQIYAAMNPPANSDSTSTVAPPAQTENVDSVNEKPEGE